MPLPEWLQQGDQPKDHAPDPPAADPEPDEPDAADEPDQADEIDEIDEFEESQDLVETGVEPAPDEQVLGMLSQLEQRLEQLGSAQREYEEKLAALAHHEHAAENAGAGAEIAAAHARQVDSMQESVDTARAESEKLSHQLAAVRVELEERTAEVEALQVRVAELEQELAEASASGGLAGDGDSDDAEALNDQIRELQDELRRRDRTIEEHRQTIEKMSGAGPIMARDSGETDREPDAAQEMIERQRTQIERLTEQLAALSADADPEAIASRDERIAELEEELDQARSTMPKVSKLMAAAGSLGRKGRKAAAPDDGGGDGDERVARLEAECARLREEAARATLEAERLKDSVVAGDDESRLDPGQITALKAQITDLRKQLKQTRADGAAAAPATPPAPDAAPGAQSHLRIGQLSMPVEDGDEDEILTQARKRPLMVLAVLGALLAASAVASWLAADRIMPATRAASVRVEAVSRHNTLLSPEELQEWHQWHTQLLADEKFHEEVARRLADRRLDKYARSSVVGKLLAKDLTIDSAEPGAFTLTLVGKDRHEIVTILDTVATTLARESALDAGQRTDGADAVVRGERREHGQILYSSVSPRPVSDHRKIAFAVIFVVITGVGGLGIVRVRRFVRNTRQAMREDDLLEAADGPDNF